MSRRTYIQTCQVYHDKQFQSALVSTQQTREKNTQYWEAPAFSMTPSYVVRCWTIKACPFKLLTRERQVEIMLWIAAGAANHWAPSCLSSGFGIYMHLHKQVLHWLGVKSKMWNAHSRPGFGQRSALFMCKERATFRRHVLALFCSFWLAANGFQYVIICTNTIERKRQMLLNVDLLADWQRNRRWTYKQVPIVRLCPDIVICDFPLWVSRGLEESALATAQGGIQSDQPSRQCPREGPVLDVQEIKNCIYLI